MSVLNQSFLTTWLDYEQGNNPADIFPCLYTFRKGKVLRNNKIGGYMKKFLVPLVILLTLSFLLTACGTKTPSTTSTTQATTPAVTTQPVVQTTTTATTSTPPAAPTPKYGGTFKFVDPRAPSTTIGWFAEAGAQGGMWSYPTYESFMECDVNNQLTPALATKWEVASDLKSITLTLRKGVKFHDGSDFNATVAKWNLEQMMALKSSTDYTNMSSIDIVDEYTIKINLIKYQNSMLNTLGAIMIVSKDAFDKGGKEGLRWNPVGTGPFKFVSFQRDVVIKFAKFNDYWRKDAKGNALPYLDAVEMYFVADPVTMSAAFEAGDFYAMGGDLSSVHYDLQQKGYPIVSAFTGAYTLTPDSKNADSPWSNLKVRQAADYAIDRDALVKARGFGFWKSIYQFANPGTPSYINDLTNRSFNLDKAKQLMADAGYPNGFQTKIFADVASSDRDAITAVQNMLSKIGIQGELQILDFASYGNYRTKGWNNGILAGMTGFMANMNSAMGMYWAQTANFYPSVTKSDELQAMHLASLASKDFDPALEQKVIRYIYDNALTLPLWAGVRGDVTKTFVKDSGFYSLQSWPGWKPYNTWLDK
jgi:peptide/nickel transport system substrate-binding protein